MDTAAAILIADHSLFYHGLSTIILYKRLSEGVDRWLKLSDGFIALLLPSVVASVGVLC